MGYRSIIDSLKRIIDFQWIMWYNKLTDKLEFDEGDMMKVSITDYEDYLYDHYKSHGIDTSLFMKLVEEVGEVAEVLNKRDGRKASDSEDLKSQLANELVDVIHYAFAIASLNQINLNDVILEKDKKASIKYRHEGNLEQFLLNR